MLRVYRGFSATDLSTNLRWTPKRVAAIEDLNRGSQPTLGELEQLCKYFEISIDDLFHKVAVIKFEDPQ